MYILKIQPDLKIRLDPRTPQRKNPQKTFSKNKSVEESFDSLGSNFYPYIPPFQENLIIYLSTTICCWVEKILLIPQLTTHIRTNFSSKELGGFTALPKVGGFTFKATTDGPIIWGPGGGKRPWLWGGWEVVADSLDENGGGGLYLKKSPWFRIFFIFTPIWGNDPIWRAYFSNGLKPPTSELSCHFGWPFLF